MLGVCQAAPTGRAGAGAGRLGKGGGGGLETVVDVEGGEVDGAGAGEAGEEKEETGGVGAGRVGEGGVNQSREGIVSLEREEALNGVVGRAGALAGSGGGTRVGTSTRTGGAGVEGQDGVYGFQSLMKDG